MVLALHGLALLCAGPARGAPPASLAGARIVADEIITTTTPSNNGSSPMWCAGAPLLVRTGGAVWASISVHDPGAPPYCNTHWELWRRPDAGAWEKVKQGPAASEREPCPLFLADPASLVLSVHPKLLPRSTDRQGETAWFCQPALAVFDPQRLDREPGLWMPEFAPGGTFGQHSYRSVGVDAATGAFLLLVIDRDNIYRPAWRDGAGVWHPLPPPGFPIRACYPNVVLRDRAGHVLAIGDIIEPNPEWKAEKTRVLQRSWDYVFRRLFYTWSPDLAAEGFREPLEVDSVEDTGGWMFNLDMLLDAQDRVHLLWVRRTFDHGFLRDKFFPGRPNIEEVRHAVIENGRITARETLLSRELSDEATARRRVTEGRLHQLPDGRLVAVLAVEADRREDSALYLQELDPRGRSSAAPVPLQLDGEPFTGRFFTNTPRGGSAPSHGLDLLGTGTKDGVISLRYLHVHIP
jgi:hypothetical protein